MVFHPSADRSSVEVVGGGIGGPTILGAAVGHRFGAVHHHSNAVATPRGRGRGAIGQLIVVARKRRRTVIVRVPATDPSGFGCGELFEMAILVIRDHTVAAWCDGHALDFLFAAILKEMEVRRCQVRDQGTAGFILPLVK
jgi:hypothetical protein